MAAARRTCLNLLMRKGGKAAKWAPRSERLSAALRENLKRRKAQARARATAAATPDESAAPDANGAGGRPEAKSPDFRRNRSNE